MIYHALRYRLVRGLQFRFVQLRRPVFRRFQITKLAHRTQRADPFGQVTHHLYPLPPFGRGDPGKLQAVQVDADKAKQLAEGGKAVGIRAGEAYVDVGTLHGYREAIRLLDPEPAREAPARSAA